MPVEHSSSQAPPPQGTKRRGRSGNRPTRPRAQRCIEIHRHRLGIDTGGTSRAAYRARSSPCGAGLRSCRSGTASATWSSSEAGSIGHPCRSTGLHPTCRQGCRSAPGSARWVRRAYRGRKPTPDGGVLGGRLAGRRSRLHRHLREAAQLIPGRVEIRRHDSLIGDFEDAVTPFTLSSLRTCGATRGFVASHSSMPASMFADLRGAAFDVLLAARLCLPIPPMVVRSLSHPDVDGVPLVVVTGTGKNLRSHLHGWRRFSRSAPDRNFANRRSTSLHSLGFTSWSRTPRTSGAVWTRSM